VTKLGLNYPDKILGAWVRFLAGLCLPCPNIEPLLVMSEHGQLKKICSAVFA